MNDEGEGAIGKVKVTVSDIVNEVKKKIVDDLSQEEFFEAMEMWFGMDADIILYEVFENELDGFYSDRYETYDNIEEALEYLKEERIVKLYNYLKEE